jgi:large repetitive protein
MAYGLTKSVELDALNLDQVATATDNTLFDFSSTFTIEGWYNPITLPSSNNHGLIGKWTTTGDQRSYVFRLNNASGTTTMQIVADADGAAGGASVKSSDALTLSTSTWYHMAVSVTTGSGTFYLDGSAVGTFTSLATPFSGSSVVTLGAERSDGTDGADGYFSLWRMWKGEGRSEANISNNKCNVLGATTNLSAEWTLDNVYTDNSGNGFTLTPANTPTFVSSVPAVCSVPIVTGAGNLMLLGVGA